MPAQTTTVQFAGQERTFDSKKEMLKTVGRDILASSKGVMTLRQLYYQFVGLDLIENKISQYQYLSKAIMEARTEGIIPWGWIEDRTRTTHAGDYNDGEYVPNDNRFRGNLKWFIETPDRYYRPRWQNQDNYVEVWVEKEALAGIFADVCSSADMKVVTFPSKGYTSITLLHDAAQRLRAAQQDGKTPRILYFGDYDPSGVDIQRNIRDKLNDTFNVPVFVERVALTAEQIDEYELPPQPAKRTDARYEQFVESHGDMAVELDALPPEELRELIRESANEYFDEDVYADIKEKQDEEREELREWIETVVVEDEVAEWSGGEWL